MSIIPATSEEITAFLIEQERILTKSIRRDSILENELKKHKIDIGEDVIDKLLEKLNKEIRRKYQMSLFLRQSRFQVVQQIMQVEREEQDNKVNKMDNMRNIIGILQEGFKRNDRLSIDESFLDMIEEMPDSNLLETNDVELIAEYDNIREKILSKVEKVRRLREEVSDITKINDRLEMMDGKKKSTIGSKQVGEEIAQQVTRMRYLLAMTEQL